MSLAYRAVGWNPQKRLYDAALAGGILLYLGAFVAIGSLVDRNATAETLAIRALGTAALALLHVILAIGPLARLDCRFLPLLYNRRHLGVTFFVVAAAHGVFSLIWFHGYGDLNPVVSVLTSNGRWQSLAQFPFQQLGLAALLIFLVMAATSHDFWLANLSPPVWKRLHMAVYVGYGLVVLHVAFGALQEERDPLLAAALAVGFVLIAGLHLAAGFREAKQDRELTAGPLVDGFVPVCRVDEIPEKRARVFTLGGERVAVFRYDGKVSAVSNVCRHQNGPLGEGLIADGCITCPWHGFQYRPHDGASPPPFTEKVPTFRVRLEGGRVLVHPHPNPPGTAVEPAPIGGAASLEGA